LSKIDNVCVFKHSVECPVLSIGLKGVNGESLLKNACPICPERAKMMPKAERGREYYL